MKEVEEAFAKYDKIAEKRKLENRPPIGLKPRFIHEQERVFEICHAVSRYADAGVSVPIEWISEINELTARMLDSGLPWEVTHERKW